MLTLVTVEIGQVLEELVSVAHQDLNYCTSLVGVCNKHLQEPLVACHCCKNALSLELGSSRQKADHIYGNSQNEALAHTWQQTLSLTAYLCLTDAYAWQSAASAQIQARQT